MVFKAKPIGLERAEIWTFVIAQARKGSWQKVHNSHAVSGPDLKRNCLINQHYWSILLTVFSISKNKI